MLHNEAARRCSLPCSASDPGYHISLSRRLSANYTVKSLCAVLAVTRQISRDFVRDRDLVHVDIICRDHMPAGEALVARQDRVERARSLCLRYAAVFVTRLKPLQ